MGLLLAGPFAGSRVADFGAEVIKIEPPGGGDPLREWGYNRYNGRTLWWPVMGRNKKSVTVNLRDPRGQELVRELLKTADGLIENFKPGTLERWGLAPDALHAINPRLVIVRVSGFGQTGPYADRPGFASVGEAMGGIRYVNGYPGQPPPRAGISLGDTLTGMFAAQGLLMALYWRDALGGGKGQVVDAAITESCFTMLESALPEYDKLGFVRQPTGTGLAKIAPSNIYKSRDGHWVVIAANVDQMFRRLCAVMAQPSLADDPRFVEHSVRGDNAAALDAIVAAWAATKDAADIDGLLNAAGVVAGPIYSIADIAQDPQYQARGMIMRFDDPQLGSVAVPGITPKFSDTDGSVEWLGTAEPGSHNAEILGGLLGKDEDELNALHEAGII